MEITYLGRSAFRLRGKDATIVVDPLTSGLPLGQVKAEIVTDSRARGQKGLQEFSEIPYRLVQGPGEYEIANVLIAGVPTGIEPGKGSRNTAFVFRTDDLVICHLGGTRDSLTDQQVEEIGSIDVLMVPTGGGDTLGPVQAAEVVSQLEPSIVIPMEYRVNGDQKLEPVESFCREMGSKEAQIEPKLSVTKTTLPASVRVVVLEPKGL